jgi:hypothetical protein
MSVVSVPAYCDVFRTFFVVCFSLLGTGFLHLLMKLPKLLMVTSFVLITYLFCTSHYALPFHNGDWL